MNEYLKRSRAEIDENGAIRIDGRAQVLEMLKAADPQFREIILRGLEKKDPQLARELRARLQVTKR